MTINPIACAGFLILSFTLAGIAQTVWFASKASRAFAVPLDGGMRIRGRRLFGANKTLRGFVVMVPASAAAFALVASMAPADLGLWDLSASSYAALGAIAGLGFMAGELPNSFVKRQLDIPPGCAARSSASAAVHFLIDRIDSGVGMLMAVSLAVPTRWETWATVLAVGPAIHWSFSVAMFRLGLKVRPA